ncbi:MAG: divalent-cation tolerance protein CutA [Deltaproteobacteria bacterium]|nr:divalent-cation tolerance protein CutA [Deltaproteobacteria bacterium]
MDNRMVYITASSPEEAERIGRALVQERLAACVNLVEGMRSLYWWEGAVQEGREVVLIAKTTEARVPALIARVKALHSYTCPCVVTLPLLEGNPDFLEWIVQETRDRGDG